MLNLKIEIMAEKVKKDKVTFECKKCHKKLVRTKREK